MSDDANLYEVLGVPPDATKEEIKKAYRRKSAQHHPDKKGGGDHKQMALVVKAKLTLMDDEKRAYYDEHGTEQPAVDPVQTAFADLIVGIVMNEKVEREDWIEVGTHMLNTAERECHNSLLKFKATIKRLQKAAGRLKRSEGVNLFDEVLIKKVEHIETLMERQQREIELIKALRVMLQGYRDSGAPAPSKPDYQFHGGTGFASVGFKMPPGFGGTW
jgi:hypothetical protein